MILTQHPSSRNNKGARVAGAIKQDRAYLSTSVFDESYAVKSEEECSLIYEAIKSNPLFKSYDEAELNKIVHIFEPCAVEQGEVLMRRGDEGDFFYVVQDGQLSVRIMDDGKGSILTVSFVFIMTY